MEVKFYVIIGLVVWIIGVPIIVGIKRAKNKTSDECDWYYALFWPLLLFVLSPLYGIYKLSMNITTRVINYNSQAA